MKNKCFTRPVIQGVADIVSARCLTQSLLYAKSSAEMGITMRNGYLRVSAATPCIQVGDAVSNREEIFKLAAEAYQDKVQLLVFPELCLTGYTCGDLFSQSLLLDRAWEQLLGLCEDTKNMDMMIAAGLPFEWEGGLYNVAAVFLRGEILGLVPKMHIPNYSEFYEARHFARGFVKPVWVRIQGREVPFGAGIKFQCESIKDFTLGVEICEDLWVPKPPSIDLALKGATVIANLSASDETTGKARYRRELIGGQSARLVSGYIYADAGEGESTTDLVFAGHNLIAENGTILAEGKRFLNQRVTADLDLERLRSERRRLASFVSDKNEEYVTVTFTMEDQEDSSLLRYIDPAPFVPGGKEERGKRCEEILSIQTMGLKKRLDHTGCQSAVIGISGGLDSTLALLVTVRAFDALGIPRHNICAVTMPCFGTTDRTYQNALALTRKLDVTLMTVNIKEAVALHFRDIGQDPEKHDVTYENAQARERTQVLMDIANQRNGMVIGTGDMSELALGWATYNGDHMSMYGVNASVPKTLVRHLVGYYAKTCEDAELKAVLLDVLDTPVSPELLPPKDGEIAQKTEDIVGPYELHDFFLYYMLRFGFTPERIYFLAKQAFAGVYGNDVILKWLKTFYRRFFSQQFKRSCLPDGPKVGSVAVSPRGDLRMPSDASARLWLDSLDTLE